MSEPTYKLCPHCGEPIEAALFDSHVPGCDGSIPARLPLKVLWHCPNCRKDNHPIWNGRTEPGCISCGATLVPRAHGEPIGNVKEYLDRELPDELESIADRAERLADRHLRDDGSERGRR